MTEEEYFRKYYPDFCYSSGKPLSPYWDFFQDGVEFGERQSEKKIEELDIQKEIEKYFTESTGFGRDKIANFMDIVNKALKQKGEKIEELEQKLEQTEKDLTDYQFNYPTIKELENENAELKSEKGCETCTKFDEVKLTKAKEHIRTLISCLIDWVQEGDKDYCHIAEAEQFLKEIEK